MFRPDSNRDRTDYSGILMPPDGYRLDRAVGTTYSLDLEALTAVAICLGLSEETDSKLMQNPIGMLNALQKVSDKIVLFCEAGQIKVPTKPTALSILLEKMVVEVALPKDRQLGRYPAFHPKTWILAYVNAEGDKKYRFVVMSRNLTFDRSWDISFAMDSSKNVRQKKKTQPICDFLDYLVTNVHNTSNNAGKKRNLIRGLCADIKDVSFSLDSKIFGEDFEVLPLGIGKNAYRMQEDILFCKERGNANSTFNELVVMSPFLSESVIADFNLTDRALSDCKRTLVTRRSELGKLKASDVDNFTIYALKDEIIDGEEEISDELADKKKQDIHAKIYLRRKYSDVDLYLGSMNASYSAINKNVEMMLWLGTKNMYLNGDKFLEDIFCGPVGDAKNPFEQVTVADDVLETESDNRNLLEQKIKDLCRVKRQAVISEDNENAGKYKIEVEFSGIESDSEVKRNKGFIAHIDKLRSYLDAPEEIHLGRKPEDLLETLVNMVLGSPAICIYRSNGRSTARATSLAKVFVNNFNLPESTAIIDLAYGRCRDDNSHWQNVLKYCKDGCFQAMIDEYIHMLKETAGFQSDGNQYQIVHDMMMDSLKIHTATYIADTYPDFKKRINGADRKSDGCRIRSSYAVGFTKDAGDNSKVVMRKENIRNAFNSPMRPFVLATTSIGQEGLDFHNYCRVIMHWNLPSNPIDLEQREGRINRFKCLAIRQNVADKYGKADGITFKRDIWTEMFEAAKAEKQNDQSELVPFWCFGKNQSVKIERLVPMYPMSKDEVNYERLIKILSLYRLTLGQARQEELLEYLFKEFKETSGLKKLFIDLSPFSKGKEG